MKQSEIKESKPSNSVYQKMFTDRNPGGRSIIQHDSSIKIKNFGGVP